MAIFRRREPQVISRGVGTDTVEETKTRKVGRDTVEIRRVRESPPPAETKKRTSKSGQKTSTSRKADKRGGTDTKQRRDTRPRPDRGRRPQKTRTELGETELILPPETERKQMLVRVMPQQTQVVVLEGNELVEHYVTRPDQDSMAGNVYLGKVRNVLPGMEAAFVDFGAAKNGVLYAGDVQVGRGRNRPRIEDVLKPGDQVLVQVVKDPMGQKGARLTNQVSLPGRYLVLVPDSDIRGISRRLPEDARDRLREVLKEIQPKGFGLIVRTAAAAAPKEQLEDDIARLVRRWETITAEQNRSGDVPRLVYQEPGLLIRVIREHFTPEFRRLLIDDPKAFDEVVSYLDETAPDMRAKVRRYEDQLPIFTRFHVDDQLRKAMGRKVWLKSGGHLIIENTEALTVVDVNTGKFVGSSNLEETVLQNNLEAAEEIGRQLRLRDIGGIIVIDFIDMEIEVNRKKVLRSFKEALAKDKTRTQVFDVSNLGLVEMTRKNVSAGLVESFSETCPTCEGRGILIDEDAAAEGAHEDH